MKSVPPKVIAPLVFLVSCLQFPASSVVAQCDGTWTQRTPAAEPSARTYHAMAYDSARFVTVLFGGIVNNADNGETWEWDGTNWTQRMPATAPSPRNSHALAYDSARGVTVLFGGYDGADKNDTWEWDGTNWTQQSPAVSPSLRSNHAMVFDSARGVTVLIGGYSGNQFYNDTWEWDGANWSKRSPAAAPPARAYHAMAYDSVRRVTVLFGGILNFNNDVSGETWEWDGANWSNRSPAAAPTARFDFAMAYDAARFVTVLFGGFATGGRSPETWEWDGANWSRRTPPVAPSARDAFAMAYDSARSVTVLFGGQGGAGEVGETWEWAGPRPYIAQQPAAQNVASGQSAMFSITVDGAAPLSFQWRKDGAPLADGGAIAGTSTAALTINPVADTDAGSYDCEVSNPCGDILSQAAALTITPAPAGCGACGAGVPMMMPLALVGLVAVRRRRTSPFKKERSSP